MLGGISGALGQRAEAIHEAMPVEHQMLTRRIFTRLSTLGDGTGDTRRRVRRSELGRDPAIDTVLATFGTARLLAFDHDPMTREPTIEVADEAMLRGGAVCASGSTTTATVAGCTATSPTPPPCGTRPVVTRASCIAAVVWRRPAPGLRSMPTISTTRNGRSSTRRSRRSAWPSKPSIAAHVGCIDCWSPSPSWRSSRRWRACSPSAPAAGQSATNPPRPRRRPRPNSSAAAADEQRVAADEAAARAVSARDEAEQTAFDAETARIAASVPTIATSDASLAMLLAAESYQREQSAATLGALHDALRGAGDVLRFVPSKVLGLASEFFFADDRIVAASLPDKVLVLDPTTLEVIEEFTMDDPAPFVVGLSGSFLDVHDGHAVWVGMQHAWVLDLETGASRPLPGGPPSGAKFDSTSGRLALVDDTGALSLFESATSDLPSWTVAGDGRRTVGEMAASEPFVRGLGDARLLSSLAFDPSGSSVWIARGLGPQRHDIVDGRVITTVELSTAGSALGQRLTTFGDDVLAVNDSSTLNFIDVTTGGARPVLSVVPPDVIIDVIDVGAAMLVAFYSGRYSLIRRDGAIVRDRVPNHVGQGGGYGLTPDGRLLVSGAKGFVELALDGGTLLRDAVPGSEVADFFFVSGDGRHAISDFGPSTAASARVLWECGVSGRQCRLSDQVRVVDGSAVPFSLFAEPDFRIRADVGTDVVTLVDPAGTEIGRVPTPVGAPVGNLFVPPSREWVAVSGYFSGVLDVYSLPRGELIASVPVTSLAAHVFGSLDGRRLIVPSAITGLATVIDTATWSVIDGALPDGETKHATFSADGRILVTIGQDGTVAIRDGNTFQPIHTLVGDSGEGAWNALSADGRLLLVSIGRIAQLWDVESGEPIGGSFEAEPFWNVPIAGPTLMMAEQSSVYGASITRFEVDRWPEMACEAAGRNLTLEEWERYGPRDEPYHVTCPQWPSGEDAPSDP